MKNYYFLFLSLILGQFAVAQTSTFYDFNTAGQLTSYFNQTGTATNVIQSTNTGLAGSGAVNITSSYTNEAFTTKDGYSLGAVGSTYTFSSFIKSVYNSGYSGLGFTTSSPAVFGEATPTGRPEDALGISVHGGGFEFHNGLTNYSGSWSQASSGSLTAVKSASIFDLLNNGSSDDWYKVVFIVKRATATTYDMRVEIWPSNANGVLLNSAAADAIFEVNGITNSTITNAPILHSYFNFSGSRVSDFDNYAINLVGGTVIQQGAPVVLTSSGSTSANTITVSGNVTSENGSSVTERGFVYGTSQNPTTADNKVVSGFGTGNFSQSVSGLNPNTAYYVRSYAINTAGISYGSELLLTTPIIVYTQGTNKYGGIDTNPANVVDKSGAVGSGYGANKNGKINVFKDGLTRARAAISASKIKQDYPTSGDGVYWIDLPGVGPKQTYCLMDNKYDGGGWMLALKATKLANTTPETPSTTFNYAADYWTTANTLNSTDVSRNDADAKYDVMNRFEAKDMMAIWPDITVNSPTVTESGSIDNLDRWSWLQNDFHSGNKTTLISKFNGDQVTYETSITGAMSFSGYKSGVFSSQPGFSFYGFNYTGKANGRVRWGFAWNQEADQLTNDTSGGIGMDSGFGDYSAGDKSSPGEHQTIGGINRSARVELYIR